MFQEELRGAVQERMPRQLGASDQPHKPQVQQRLDDGVHRHAANLLDFGLGDRLAVGDDGQRFERGARKAIGAIKLQERAHVASAGRRGLQAIGARAAHEPKAEPRALKLLLQTVQGFVDLARGAALVNAHHFGVLALFRFDAAHADAQIVRGQRLFGGKQQRPHDFLQRTRQRYLGFFSTHRVPQGVGLPAVLSTEAR